MAARGWINGDESAKEMLSRVLTERPLLLLPPLHRVPLRVGNVVELVGPSPSAKTQILIQAAVSCILPKEWNGVHYGGLGHLVMFIDLDCRFDILRLAEMLKHRILEGSSTRMYWEQKDVDAQNCETKERENKSYDEELFAVCMRRFLYIRCYDSIEFLATLKTLHYQLEKEREAHGISVHLLMIDSIGAHYWLDRASMSLPLYSRKSLSLQSVTESVVQEIRELLLVHPMLVLATKSTILGDIYSVKEIKRNFRNWSSPSSSNSINVTNTQQPPYREYMPSIWQSFVTHRIFLRASDDHLALGKHPSPSVYLSEWLLPSLKFLDKFIVRDVRTSLLSSFKRNLVELVLSNISIVLSLTFRLVSSLFPEACLCKWNTVTCFLISPIATGFHRRYHVV